MAHALSRTDGNNWWAAWGCRQPPMLQWSSRHLPSDGALVRCELLVAEVRLALWKSASCVSRRMESLAQACCWYGRGRLRGEGVRAERPRGAAGDKLAVPTTAAVGPPSASRTHPHLGRHRRPRRPPPAAVQPGHCRPEQGLHPRALRREAAAYRYVMIMIGSRGRARSCMAFGYASGPRQRSS
jgi:hypothetical protein